MNIRSRTILPSIRIIVLTPLCALLCACAQDSGGSSEEGSTTNDTSNDTPGIVGIADSDSDSSSDIGVSAIRVTTYNLGLLPAFVPLSDQRLTPLSERLAEDSSDILCIQEAWRPSDFAQIDASLSFAYPFSMRSSARQKFASSAPACTLSSFEPLAACLLSQCSAGAEDILGCAASNCRQTLFTLADTEPECAAALFAQSGRSASELLQIQDELLSEDRQAGLFAFGGESGTVLYSKFPLEDQEVVDFFDESTTSRRVALLATVRIEDTSLRVGCTHLSSNLESTLPYTGQFSNWEGENFAQAQRLIASVSSASAQGVILAGDFNCSEANGQTGAMADFSGTCHHIREAGFQDPVAEALRCTYCNENLLNQSKEGQGEQRDLVLDHIFTQGLQPVTRAERRFDELVNLSGTDSNLSDHYGVSLTLSIP